jgi:pimeloyl-ACP methyl ester carboxylesterase
LETKARSLSNADHLAVLHAIWQEETRGAHAERYRHIVLAAPPPEYAADGLTSPQATWLWRTLRAAETAGLDPVDVVREVVAARPLSGTRDVAADAAERLRLPDVDSDAGVVATTLARFRTNKAVLRGSTMLFLSTRRAFRTLSEALLAVAKASSCAVLLRDFMQNGPVLESGLERSQRRREGVVEVGVDMLRGFGGQGFQARA